MKVVSELRDVLPKYPGDIVLVAVLWEPGAEHVGVGKVVGIFANVLPLTDCWATLQSTWPVPEMGKPGLFVQPATSALASIPILALPFRKSAELPVQLTNIPVL